MQEKTLNLYVQLMILFESRHVLSTMWPFSGDTKISFANNSITYTVYSKIEYTLDGILPWSPFSKNALWLLYLYISIGSSSSKRRTSNFHAVIWSPNLIDLSSCLADINRVTVQTADLILTRFIIDWSFVVRCVEKAA